MTLTECLESLVKVMRKEQISFAVAGGLAASLYRAEPRLTADVDLIVMLGTESSQRAVVLLEGMGLKTTCIRKADLDGGPLFAIKQKSTPVMMVAGRDPDSVTGVGADLLLSEIPWVQSALARAEMHQVDFGFGRIPVLTIEDVILAKLSALGASVQRPKDLDDLVSIYDARPSPDMVYLQAQIDALKLQLPPQTKRLLPPEVAQLL